jgi:hypothetical protein
MRRFLNRRTVPGREGRSLAAQITPAGMSEFPPPDPNRPPYTRASGFQTQVAPEFSTKIWEGPLNSAARPEQATDH